MVLKPARQQAGFPHAGDAPSFTTGRTSRYFDVRVKLRTELPVSVSELAGTSPTAVLDSTGDFPLQAVRSVPLLPNRHSATTDDARLLSSFEGPPVFRDDETATPF